MPFLIGSSIGLVVGLILFKLNDENKEKAKQKLLSSGNDTNMIYFYRKGTFSGAVAKFQVSNNETLINKFKNKSFYSIPKTDLQSNVLNGKIKKSYKGDATIEITEGPMYILLTNEFDSIPQFEIVKP